MKVIILSKTPYKEKDVIFNAISEDKYFSFRARGVIDNKSPYVWLNNELTIADIEVSEDKRSKYLSLKEAKPISSSLIGDGDLNYLFSLSVIGEAANKMLDDDEKHLMFPYIEGALKSLKEKKDYKMVILIFLANATKLAGAELNVDSCISCGSTSDIVAFSFADGGFYCRKCLEPDTPIDLNSSQMHLIRYIYRAPNFSCVKTDKFTEQDKNAVLHSLRNYIIDAVGVYIESLKKIIK